MRRQIGIRALAVLLSTVTSISLAGIAFAAEFPKVALVNVAPDEVGAGTTTGFQVSVQNLAGQQQVGSADITLPADFVLTGVSDPAGPATASTSGNVVQLRNLSLPPGDTVETTATAVAPCIAADYTWTAQVKQSNNFAGPPGNDFTIDPSSQLTTTVSGTCSVGFSSVGFSGNPTTSVKNETITAATLDPSTGAPSVRVGLFDDDGILITESSLQTTVTVAIGNNPGGGELSGAKVEPTSSGVATFDDLSIDETGLGYTLTSTPSDDEIASGESSGFDVVDSGGICHANAGCSHSASLGGTTADLFSNSTEDGYHQFLALNVEDVDCADYTEVSAVVTFGVSAETGQAQVTLTIERRGLPSSRKSLNSFQVCYGAPKPFEVRGGGQSPAVGDGFVGLLPECADVAGAPPCIIGRSMTPQTYSITFSTPLGDPKARG
jgi:hypothetical protein